MKQRQYFIRLLAGGLIILFILNLFLPQNQPQELATWFWNTELLESDLTKVMKFIETENITTIYLQYSPRIEDNYYQSFISLMTERDVKVYALEGSPTWAMNDTEETAFLTWFASYQRASQPSQQFKGIHLDVEPYLHSRWESEQAEVIREYQAMVKRVLEQSKELKIVFGVDIPFWFDEIYFNNEFGTGNLAQWLIRTVDEITLMAYRNYASGDGGMIEISQNEMEWANQEKKKVLIAIETLPLPEDYISFSELGKEKMEAELDSLKTFYLSDQAFQGIAIHHLESWKALK